MKQNIIAGAFGFVAMALCFGCTHRQVMARAPAEVVQAAQSLAPWSEPPRYKTVELVPGLEWSVVITENVPGRKFEHYEIKFRILKADENRSEISVEAERVDLMPLSPSRKSAPSIARRYAENLDASLNREKPQSSPEN
jgi:hypothetical protein